MFFINDIKKWKGLRESAKPVVYTNIPNKLVLSLQAQGWEVWWPETARNVNTLNDFSQQFHNISLSLSQFLQVLTCL